MNDARHCPQCGAELATDAPEGLCPQCLMKLGLASESVPGSAAPQSGADELHPSRSGAGQVPQLAERAIHLKCPHCGNRIQLVEPGPQEVTCLNCGSSFQVEPGVTTSYRPDAIPKSVGKFQVLELLGRGAFGAVYKARDTELDRIVAVKVPRAGCFATSEEEERFLREARSAAHLKHASIVPVHEIGHEQGVPYIVSDFIDGLTLADRLTAGRPSFRESAELLAQIADALDHAHRERVIHRDIKPGNILIDHAGRPHLTDFGLARRDEGEITVTLDGQILGTPAYMSPEQAAGEQQRIDARSDIYSLGVVLYELLTGELPFRGNKRMLIHQVLNDEPRPPRSLNDRIPRDLETVCLKAMAKEPGRRYATAREFADDLRRWLTGEPIQARPVGRSERLWRWCRRNPTVASLTAILGLVFICAFAGVTWHWRQAEFARRETHGKAQDLAKALTTAEFLREAATAAKEKADSARTAEEEQRRLATERAGDLEQQLYFNQITLAEREYLARNPAAAEHILDLCNPGLRRWEWHHLKRLCHPELLAITRPDKKPVSGVVFSPDGKRLAAAYCNELRQDARPAEVMIWDVRSGEQLTTVEAPAPVPRFLTRLAFSPDGGRLAAAGEDFAVRVWDVGTGGTLFTLSGHSGHVNCVSFSHDGQRIATASDDATVRIWDAGTGREIRMLPGRGDPVLPGHGDSVTSVAFSPDGRRLASSSDGPRLASSSDYTVKIWDAVSGEALSTINSSAVSHLSFIDGGRQLASLGGYGNEVRVWDTTTFDEVHKLKLQKDVGFLSSMALGPEAAQFAAVATDGNVYLWDAKTGQEAVKTRRHDSQQFLLLYQPMAFSPRGDLLAAGFGDGTVKIWDSNPGTETLIIGGGKAWVEALAFSPDGRLLVSGGAEDPSAMLMDQPSELVLWDAVTGEVLRTLSGHTKAVFSAAFLPDGKRLVSASRDETIKVWDITSGQSILSLPGAFSPKALAVSPDGTRIASAAADNTVKIWDARTGHELLCLRDHRFRVRHVAFSPDGGRLATATAIEFDKLSSPERPEGEKAGEVKVWDATTGQEILLISAHRDGVAALAFSSDGKTIATAAGEFLKESELKLWDAATGQEVLSLVEPQQGGTLFGPGVKLISFVSFTADGQRLVSASTTFRVSGAPGTQAAQAAAKWEVRLWDTKTGREILIIGGTGIAASVALSRDGNRLGLGGSDGSIRIWDAAPVTDRNIAK